MGPLLGWKPVDLNLGLFETAGAREPGILIVDAETFLEMLHSIGQMNRSENRPSSIRESPDVMSHPVKHINDILLEVTTVKFFLTGRTKLIIVESRIKKPCFTNKSNGT